MSASTRYALRLILGSTAYFAAGVIGLQYASMAGAVTLIWAPAGIGLALIVFWGWEMVPAIVLGQIAIGASSPVVSVPLILAASLAGSTEALLAAAILRRTGFASLQHTADGPRLLAAAIGASLVGAAIGTVGLVGSQLLSQDDGPEALARWWLGDAMGILVVTPVVTACAQSLAAGLRPIRALRLLEAGTLLFLLTLVCITIFGAPIDPGQPRFAVTFLLMPVLGWAAYRFRVLGAAASCALIAGIAIWCTANGIGGFLKEDLDISLGIAFAFISAIVVSSLVLATAVDSHERTEAALRENLEWLDLIQDGAGVGPWSWDSQDAQIRGSDALLRLLGIAGAPTGANVNEIMTQLIHPDDLARVAAAVQRTWQSGEVTNLDLRIVWPDGGVRWHSLITTRLPPDRLHPERPHRLVGINIDVTERVRLEETLRRTERLASLGTFAAGLAHEINNPVGGILLAAHTARNHREDPEVVDQALDDIVEDAERTASIVKSVLQFSRAEPTHRRPENVNDCIRRAAILCADYATERAVAIELDLAEAPLIIECNATEIEQVFVNLIRNATEACTAGGTVRLESQHEEHGVLARVRDDGRGMAPAEAERAFDPLYSSRAGVGGMGLGLTICQRIIASHGGRISITGRLGKGTTVEVDLSLNGEPQ